MTNAEIGEKIRAFLQKHIKGTTFADDEDFYARGFVNSLFAMQLVLFIEKEFRIQVADEDLSIENFKSIQGISHLVARKLLVDVKPSQEQ